MSTNAKESILSAARRTAQAHGYTGLNFRDIGAEVGIKAASIYHHFPTKADLGAAVAKRYWQDIAAELEAKSNEIGEPAERLRWYPEIFRRSLASDNRLCLGSFMSAEYDDLPETVRTEVQAFADINIEWLAGTLVSAKLAKVGEDAHSKASAIFASVAGAQLLARSRSDITLFDMLIGAYRTSGLLPGGTTTA